MKQKGFSLNLDRCIGCQACVIACRNENQERTEIHWRRVIPATRDYYLSISCNHCKSPECFRVCPNRAYYKRSDGIVIIDSSRCDGCRKCIVACPFHAPTYDKRKHKVSKCNFCLPRQLEGKIPACVEACGTEALKVIDMGEELPDKHVTSVEGMPNIHLTNPSIVFYPFMARKQYWLTSPNSKDEK